jgi:hypothetical protein
MRVRRTDIEFAAAGDQDVSLFAQAIAQFFARLRRLDITGYLYVIVLAFVGTGGGNVRQDAFGIHTAVT